MSSWPAPLRWSQLLVCALLVDVSISMLPTIHYMSREEEEQMQQQRDLDLAQDNRWHWLELEPQGRSFGMGHVMDGRRIPSLEVPIGMAKQDDPDRRMHYASPIVPQERQPSADAGGRRQDRQSEENRLNRVEQHPVAGTKQALLSESEQQNNPDRVKARRRLNNRYGIRRDHLELLARPEFRKQVVQKQMKDLASARPRHSSPTVEHAVQPLQQTLDLVHPASHKLANSLRHDALKAMIDKDAQQHFNGAHQTHAVVGFPRTPWRQEWQAQREYDVYGQGLQQNDPRKEAMHEQLLDEYKRDVHAYAHRLGFYKGHVHQADLNTLAAVPARLQPSEQRAAYTLAGLGYRAAEAGVLQIHQPVTNLGQKRQRDVDHWKVHYSGAPR